MRLSIGFALFALVAASRPAASQGRLVIVGGGLSAKNDAVYNAILAGRQGSGPFCVFPTAGATPDSDMASPVAEFRRHGAADAEGVLISSLKPETARDPKVVDQIRHCSGFFFIGGVQSRVIRAFRPEGISTPAYDALMDRWRAGAVVSGSSAGAAIMSDPMIADGTSANALTKGVKRISYIGADADDSTGGVTIAPGLGFFRAALADQHFLTRGRYGRLLTVLTELDQYDLAFGIDENTALVVDRDSLQVVGASGVVVLDKRSTHVAGQTGSDITMHLLGDGDRFDLRTRTPVLSPSKSHIAEDGPPPSAPANPFGRFELLRSLDQFSRSSSREMVLPFAQGHFVLRKTSAFTAVRGTGAGVGDAPAGLAMTGLRIEIIR